MSTNARRIGLILLMIVAVAAVIEVFLIIKAKRNFSAHTTIIEEKLVVLVEGYSDVVTAAKQIPVLSASQGEALLDIEQRIANYSEDQPIAKKVDVVNSVQVGLKEFGDANVGTTLADNETYKLLVKQLSEKSTLREELDVYNENVKLRNNILDSKESFIIVGDRDVLPFLRFDGLKEEETVINL